MTELVLGLKFRVKLGLESGMWVQMLVMVISEREGGKLWYEMLFERALKTRHELP